MLFIGVESEKFLLPRSFNPNRKVILISSLGSMNSEENQELIIKAVRKLNKKYGNDKFSTLHIGGLDPYLSRPDVV
jgi:hypothetical protein